MTRKKTIKRKPLKSHSKLPNAGPGIKEKAREQLLKSAKHLFAHKGLSGTSIRDISGRARLNSSLISYYFGSKEGIYKACLQEIGEARLMIAKEILKTPQTLEEFRLRTRMFLENMFGLYIEDRDAGLILVREYDRLHSPAEDVFKKTFLRVFKMSVDFFKAAQKKKIISSKKDPFILASLLSGTLSSQMRLDHIKERDFNRSIKNEKERRLLMDHIVDLFCQP